MEKTNEAVFTPEGLRIYSPDLMPRLGDLVTFKSDSVAFFPFSVFIISGVRKVTGFAYNEKEYLLTRPHCFVNEHREDAEDSQVAIQCERMWVGENELRKSFGAFVNGPSGTIQNRNRA